MTQYRGNLAVKRRAELKALFNAFTQGGVLQELIVSTFVDPQYSAEDRDTVLSGKRFDGSQPLSECGVNIAMAFFSMRFSSSS